MNHPTREEWMTFLYGELPPDSHANLEAHLHECPDCQRAVEGWRGTMSDLNAWKLRPSRSAAVLAHPVFKWGLAAMLMVGLGLALGRLTALPAANINQLRAALVPAIRQQLQQEFAADLQAALTADDASLTNRFRQQLRTGLDQWAANHLNAATADTQRLLAGFFQTYQANRAEDQKATLAGFQRVDQQRRTEFLTLLNKIETVAVVAEGRFQNTQQQIGELAANTQPDRLTGDSSESLIPVKNQK